MQWTFKGVSSEIKQGLLKKIASITKLLCLLTKELRSKSQSS
ncbi:hypothetical protein EV11_0133 [Prochlorococcus sp. SS52]|nr:hypothetical protein EV08_0024 [Prochlorococcus marinus str. SS2]KGG24238.1 hypothetical protein EV09_0845 [Prochlorococcus marinus str. SS35]KGG33149.1 hypothetical protein EV10_0782 [Prochlorococcus marinus str. SS51]KGG37429.1 hypothetical protein EV11_0133 [Prochlorococcus sp. SS52]